MSRPSFLALFGGRGAARLLLNQGAAAGVVEGDELEGLETIAQGEQLKGARLAHAAGANPATGLLYQAAGIEDKNAGEMSARFVIVTWDSKEVNRQGNRVHIMPNKNGQGLRSEYWEANPVVLKDHGYGGTTDPIGIAEKDGKVALTKQKSKATSTVYFHDKTQAARDTWNLVDAKILRMSSIGHRPILGAWLSRETTSRGQRPDNSDLLQFQPPNFEITETELVEWSITAVGADRGAMRQALDLKKINGENMSDETRHWLEQFADKTPAYSHGWAPTVIRQSFEPLKVELVLSMKDGAPQIALSEASPAPAAVVSQATPLIAAPVNVAPTFEQMLGGAIVQGIQAGLASLAPIIAQTEKRVADLTSQVERINGRIE